MIITTPSCYSKGNIVIQEPEFATFPVLKLSELGDFFAQKCFSCEFARVSFVIIGGNKPQLVFRCKEAWY